jgi:preprotein translocase subunit SecD
MLYFPKWLVSLILGVCALGVLLTLPNLFTAQTINSLPGWLPKKQVSLGLDLRGGSYLLLEVDINAVLTERFNNDIDSLRT